MFTQAIKREEAKQKALMVVDGKFDLKAIMTYAWTMAKNLANNFRGSKAKAFIAECMKRAWSIAKGA